MDALTAAQIRTRSQVDFGSLGYSDDADLQVLVGQATAYVLWATGRELGTVPAALVVLAEQAFQRKTETLAFRAQSENVEGMGDFDIVGSFNAGSYSETRRKPEEVANKLIDNDPVLHGLVWALCTDAMRDQWQEWFDGSYLPAFAVTEVDWFGDSEY